MKKFALAVTAVAVAAVAALTGCGNSGSDQPSTTTAGVTGTAAPADHTDADVTFAQQMIPHHAQAVEMSDILLGKPDIDPQVTELANQIKAAQGPEIEQMQTWLTQWGESTVPMDTSAMPMPGQDTPMMPGAGMETTAGMPMPTAPGGHGMGMMSAQDMAALQDAEGVEAARLFLTQMITHHQGAIAMAQTEIATGANQDAVALARAIAETQQQEITDMENILATL